MEMPTSEKRQKRVGDDTSESIPLLHQQQQQQQQQNKSSNIIQQSPPDAAAAAAAMMAQQQYGATSSVHPAFVGGMPLPPPHYDMSVMAAAWQQQQQELSPVIIRSPVEGSGGQNNSQPHQIQHPFFYPYPPSHPGAASFPYPPPPFYPTQHAMPPLPHYQQQQYTMQPSSPRPPRINTAGIHSNNSNRRSSPHQQVDGRKHFDPSQGTKNSAHATTSSGSLPPLQDIFSGQSGAQANNVYMTPLVDGSGVPEGQGGIGYGSLDSPKIYNAPVTGGGPPPSSSSSRRLPPSGRPVMVRTNSKDDATRGGGGSGNSNTRAVTPSASAKKLKSHRRSNSDTPLPGFGGRSHRRAGSVDELPPLAGPGGHNRSRTFSGGNPLMTKSRHRRTGSSSSMPSYAGSVADGSMVSHRSNFAKSSLFGGIDIATGKPIMHFPYEAIRLVMIPDPSLKKNRRKPASRKDYHEISDEDDEGGLHSMLTIGHLYGDVPPNADEYFEDYHKVSDDFEQGATPQWESLEANPLRSGSGGFCGCQCPNCSACTGRQELLPPDNYLLPVSDDIYKRMLAEVSDARTMPCGLFYCGHHEDVSHPSIWIAITLVTILFSTLLYLSLYTEIFEDS
jgi:hypothetical protein